MVNLIDEIAKVNDFEIAELLKAVLKRYAVLFPDWEVCTISLKKSDDKNEQLDRLIALLQNMKTTS